MRRGAIARRHDDNREKIARWGLSLLFVLGIHAAGGLAVMTWRATVDPVELPSSAIMIDLAPLPTAPVQERIELPPGPQQVETAPPPPEPIVEPEREPEPEPPPVKAEVVLPKPPPPRPIPRIVLPPQPERPPEPTPQPPAPATAPPAALVPLAPVAAAPAAPPTPQPPSNAVPTWQGLLLSHLERHKRYPRDAQIRRQQGVAHLRFAMDREGHVLSARIERSAGHGALDEEVLQLIRRADPLPMPPPDITGATVELVVPVQFFLR